MADEVKLTPEEAILLCEKVKDASGIEQLRVYNAISRAAPEWIQAALRRDEHLRAAILTLNARLNKLTGVEEPAASTPVADAPQAPAAPPSGEPRLGADGNPMNAQQAALEAEMDALTSNPNAKDSGLQAQPPPTSIDPGKVMKLKLPDPPRGAGAPPPEAK